MIFIREVYTITCCIDCIHINFVRGLFCIQNLALDSPKINLSLKKNIIGRLIDFYCLRN